MIPDAEKTVGRYLREHAALEDLGARVVGKTPDVTRTPWVRLTQLDAPTAATSSVDHLVGFLLQLDCYAGATGGQPEAILLGRTVRAALADMPGTHDETVVSRVRFTGMARIPDTDFEPARERVILTADIRMHS